MASIDYTQHGKIPASVVTANLNEESFFTFGHMIKGGFNFPYLKAPASDPNKWDDINKRPVLDASGNPVDPSYLPPYRTQPGLLDLHPQGAMKKSMEATVEIGFERVAVILTEDPDFINYGDITEENWNNYWQVSYRFIPDNAKILEFAEDYDGSLTGWPTAGKPPYDETNREYPVGAEFDALWEVVQDIKRHRWYRIKYLSYDAENNPTVGAISPPIPIGKDSTSFVQEINYYKRNGTVGIDALATARPATPPSFLNGLPNNVPVGWSDTMPATPIDQYLWVTRAIRELKGDINTQIGWSQPAYVPENNDLLRYSATGTPDPNTIVPTDESVTDGTNEADLVAAGWVPLSSYNQLTHKYVATRRDLGAGTFSLWRIERIAGEDGTFAVRRYKLLPRLADYDDPVWAAANKPSTSDPSNQKWLETLQAETNFLVNYFSEATFYADNTIKYNWSDPKPMTSRDRYEDYITIHPDNAATIDATKQIDDTIVKRFTGGVESHDPENMWLRANLYLGETDLSQDATIAIAYQWHKIYNAGQFLAAPVDLGTDRDILVDNTDVDGRAIFQVQMTLSDAVGSTAIQAAIDAGAIPSNPVFTEQISIKDQVDGRDGRTLSINATKYNFIKTGASSPFTLLPGVILIRAEGDNISLSAIKWYYLNGSDPINDTWVEITATTNVGTSVPKYLYKDASNNLVITGGVDTTATDVFTLVGADVYFKAVLPESGGLPALEDWAMVSLVDQADVAAGESAFNVTVVNPYFLLRRDYQGTILAGEFAVVDTAIEARKGNTLLAHTAYSVAVHAVSGALSVAADVVLANDAGSRHLVSLVAAPTWDTGEDKAFITLRITYGAEIMDRVIGIGTTLEPAGFMGLNIVSDRSTFSFDYSANGRNDIVLTANLTRQTEAGDEAVAGYLYEWKVKAGTYYGFSAGQIISGANVDENELTVKAAGISGSAEFVCTAYLTKTGENYDAPFFVDSVRINDVPDARTRVLFHPNPHSSAPALPTLAYESYPPTGSSWHQTFAATDMWMALSSDGGATWQGPMRVNPTDGIDGQPGTNGINGVNGVDGKSVEIQVSATHIQWRLVGDLAWTDLYALADLVGEQGPKGDDGIFDPSSHYWNGDVQLWAGSIGSFNYNIRFRKSLTGEAKYQIAWHYNANDTSWVLVPLTGFAAPPLFNLASLFSNVAQLNGYIVVAELGVASRIVSNNLEAQNTQPVVLVRNLAASSYYLYIYARPFSEGWISGSYFA